MNRSYYHRCSEPGCDYLSLTEDRCVIHREYLSVCEDSPCCGCCDPGRAVMPL